MERISKFRHFLFVLSPFVVGWIINSNMILIQVFIYLIWVFNIGFIVYWFWVGKQFAQLKINKLYSFLLGNSIWAVSFLVYTWQFLWTDDASRNMLLAGLSQPYALFTTTFAARIVMSYSENVIVGTQITFVSFLLMFAVFAIGFAYEGFNNRRATGRYDDENLSRKV